MAEESRHTAADVPPRPKLVQQESGVALLDVAPAVCNATLALLKKGESEIMFDLLTDVVNVTCGPKLQGLSADVLEKIIAETTSPLINDSYKDKAVQVCRVTLCRVFCATLEPKSSVQP